MEGQNKNDRKKGCQVGIVLCITLNLKTVVPIIQVLFSFLMDVNFVQMNKL